jgi:hypothetical protein
MAEQNIPEYRMYKTYCFGKMKLGRHIANNLQELTW